MTYMHPVYAIVVDCSLLGGRVPTHDEAFQYLPAEYLATNGQVTPKGLWSSASHNWWYQSVVKALCEAYTGFDELQYLLKVVVVVPPAELNSRIDSIHNLICAIRTNPSHFIECTSWYGANAIEVLKGIDEATVSRDINDDTWVAFSNFFSFLISHAAALEEARNNGKCLLYFQPQP